MNPLCLACPLREESSISREHLWSPISSPPLSVGFPAANGLYLCISRRMATAPHMAWDVTCRRALAQCPRQLSRPFPGAHKLLQPYSPFSHANLLTACTIAIAKESAGKANAEARRRYEVVDQDQSKTWKRYWTAGLRDNSLRRERSAKGEPSA